MLPVEAANTVHNASAEQSKEENAGLFDFSLSDGEMRLLSGIITLMESTVSNLAPKWMEDAWRIHFLVL